MFAIVQKALENAGDKAANLHLENVEEAMMGDSPREREMRKMRDNALFDTNTPKQLDLVGGKGSRKRASRKRVV